MKERLGWSTLDIICYQNRKLAKTSKRFVPCKYILSLNDKTHIYIHSKQLTQQQVHIKDLFIHKCFEARWQYKNRSTNIRYRLIRQRKASNLAFKHHHECLKILNIHKTSIILDVNVSDLNTMCLVADNFIGGHHTGAAPSACEDGGVWSKQERKSSQIYCKWTTSLLSQEVGLSQAWSVQVHVEARVTHTCRWELPGVGHLSSDQCQRCPPNNL